jgi:hypothetical protein
VAREVVEASVFWGGDLFAVKYFALGERVLFDDVPKAEGVEVRTRVVEAAPKMPRNGWDLPFGALAMVAALAHAGVVVSVVKHDGAAFGGNHEVARDDARIASYFDSHGDTRPEAMAAVGITSASARDATTRVDEDDVPTTREELGDIGMVGLLARYRGDGTASAWVSELHEGNGRMWGDAVGESWGVAGLSLSGMGEGGGGNALGNYVLDRVHTTDDFGSGYGAAHGHLGGEHHAATIICRLTSCPIACNRIAPEVIKRVVQANIGRFRGCYVDGLRRDPKLAGKVVTKFVIGRDGTVQTAADGGSDLPDPSVVSCVVRAFTSLEFPANPDGVATVVYPFDMQPE